MNKKINIDSTQSIWISAKHFFSGTLLSRLAGMLRDMAMAYAFGTGAAIASFMLAFRLSHLLRRLFGEGALQAAFIPEFEALRTQEPKKAFQFFRDLVLVLTLVLSLVIILGCLSLGLWLLYGEMSTEQYEVIFLTLLMLPSLLFICLFGLNAALLQCEKNYFIPGVAPVAFNVIWILAVFVLKNNNSSAMPLLALGVIVACFFQWFMTVPKTLSILWLQLGPLLRNIRLSSSDIWKIGKPLALGFIGVAASQINSAMDALFARYAEPEGPAFLWYAMRIQQLPLALFGIAIAGALLPPLSRAIKNQDWENYHHFLQDACKRTFTLMLPITAAFFILGDTCISLLYGRGEFTYLSIFGTTRCLWAYNLGLLPTTFILILAPACYAKSHYRLPALAACLSMGVNLLLNWILIMKFGLGAVSVALATSLSAWINVCFLTVSLKKNHLFLFPISSYLHFFKVSLAVLIASCGTLVVRFWTQTLFSSDFILSFQVWNQIFQLIIQLSSFALLFIVPAFFLKVFSFTQQKPGVIIDN
jgi:putative peptidoglycan lipid II flippase